EAASPSPRATCRPSPGRLSDPPLVRSARPPAGFAPPTAVTPPLDVAEQVTGSHVVAPPAWHPRTEVGVDDGGPELVQLRRHDGAVDPPGHRGDELRQRRVLAEPEERRPGPEPHRDVELAGRAGDGERVRRVVEPDLAVRLEVRGRFAVGDHQQHRLRTRMTAE